MGLHPSQMFFLQNTTESLRYSKLVKHSYLPGEGGYHLEKCTHARTAPQNPYTFCPKFLGVQHNLVRAMQVWQI